MMTGPWNNNDAAFAPMFCDEVAFQLNSLSALSGVIECCAFPMESVDPFAEGDNESDVRSVTLLVRKSDWTFSGSTKPKVGDRFTFEDLNYKVCSVMLEQNWWKLVGRSST